MALTITASWERDGMLADRVAEVSGLSVFCICILIILLTEMQKHEKYEWFCNQSPCREQSQGVLQTY